MAKKRADFFVKFWNETAADIHQWAQEKGWWIGDRNDGEMIALIHSELSEALEALRSRSPDSVAIPGFLKVEEELADTVIRLMDMAHARGWRVAQAIQAKREFNRTRPHRHGRVF